MKSPLTIKTRLTSIAVIIFLLVGLMSYKPLQAQVIVSVNIVSQPLWGPVGYDYVDYYYLPEAEVYYYVPNRQFFYMTDGRWFYSTYLPARYSIDLYRTYKVVVYGPKPYLRHQSYLKKYGKYKAFRNKQVIIRDSHDKKYYVVKGHPGANKPKTVKPKTVKPRSTKGNSEKQNNSRGNSVKPNRSDGNKDNRNQVQPAGSKGNNTHQNNSNGKSSKGNGGRKR